jgi:hypothetical protein
VYSIKDKSRSVLLQALAPSRGNNLGIVNFSIDVVAEIALEQTWKAEQAAEIVRTTNGCFSAFSSKIHVYCTALALGFSCSVNFRSWQLAAYHYPITRQTAPERKAAVQQK